MSTGCQDATASEPKFSIIIPMEFHRGQWERCWQGWSAQTVDKSLYEIILVVSPGFQDRAQLSRVAADCVVVSDCTHDIGLCVAGAAKARGQYLFFTECHCWPEPDVLENCLAAIDKNPDWAGFSCLSLPIDFSFSNGACLRTINEGGLGCRTFPNMMLYLSIATSGISTWSIMGLPSVQSCGLLLSG